MTAPFQFYKESSSIIGRGLIAVDVFLPRVLRKQKLCSPACEQDSFDWTREATRNPGNLPKFGRTPNVDRDRAEQVFWALRTSFVSKGLSKLKAGIQSYSNIASPP